MKSPRNTDVVYDIDAAFGRGNLAAILAAIDPGVAWELPGPRSMPWAGSFSGHDGVTRFFAVDGDLVVVLGSERIRSFRTSRAYECHWAHAFSFSGGKIVAFRELTDTAAIAAAFGPGAP